MQMPGRHYTSADGYRYGFQGEEQDDEIKGEGNSINYKFRMHDPRLGRFFAVDPLADKYPHYSPYSFSGNRVIDAVELEGLEPALVYHMLIGSYGETVQELATASIIGFNIKLVEAFKFPFPEDGAAQSLIDHYVWGQGTDYKLNLEHSIEVYPYASLSISDDEFNDYKYLKEGEVAEYTKDHEVYAGTPGTFGHHYVTVKGKIFVNSEGVLQFEGNTYAGDNFDFGPSEHRDIISEGQVTVARNLLPGEEFNAKAIVPVTQVQGEKLLLRNSEHEPQNFKKPSTITHRAASSLAGDAGAIISEMSP